MKVNDHGPRQIALQCRFLDVWRFVTSWEEIMLYGAEIPIDWGKRTARLANREAVEPLGGCSANYKLQDSTQYVVLFVEV